MTPTWPEAQVRRVGVAYWPMRWTADTSIDGIDVWGMGLTRRGAIRTLRRVMRRQTAVAEIVRVRP